MRQSVVVTFLLASGLLPVANAFTPTSDGLYAVFETTEGEFTAQLNYTEASQTVANFVRLAEGSIPTMDLTSGVLANQPFYDGITFHRVVSGFVIQAGSPNGEGTDGPGYVLPDEFVSGQSHGSAGVLSMANSGPNSNGSQFFITLDSADQLDGRHTVFGSIVDGLSVVQAIGSAPLVSGTDTPVNPVEIQSVQIVREGTAANAWDESAPTLPMLSYNPLTIEPAAEAGKIELFFNRRPFTRNYLTRTANFVSWNLLGSRGETIAGPVVESFIRNDFPADEGGRMYRVVEDQKVIPVDMEGHSMRLNPPEFLPSYTVNFGANYEGTYEHTDPGGSKFSGTLTYRWYSHENVETVHLVFDLNLITYRNGDGAIVYVPNQPQQVSLTFGNDTSGTFDVHYYRPNAGWDAYPDMVLEGGVFLLTKP